MANVLSLNFVRLFHLYMRDSNEDHDLDVDDYYCNDVAESSCSARGMVVKAVMLFLAEKVMHGDCNSFYLLFRLSATSLREYSATTRPTMTMRIITKIVL